MMTGKPRITYASFPFQTKFYLHFSSPGRCTGINKENLLQWEEQRLGWFQSKPCFSFLKWKEQRTETVEGHCSSLDHSLISSLKSFESAAEHLGCQCPSFFLPTLIHYFLFSGRSRYPNLVPSPNTRTKPHGSFRETFSLW